MTRRQKTRLITVSVLAVAAASAVWLATNPATTVPAAPRPALQTTTPATGSPAVAATAPTGHASSTPLPDAPTPAITPADTGAGGDDEPVVRVAEGFVKAFARPSATVSADDWWAKVEPWLTPEAANDLVWVDPRNVPYTRLTGPAVIAADSDESEVQQTVLVPTDAGTYRIWVQVVTGTPLVAGFDASGVTR